MSYSYYRSPRVVQEKRQNIERKYNRPRRNPCNLPDPWDDIYAQHSRCWKRHRKTQYKTVNKFDSPPKKDSSRYAEHTKRKTDPHIACNWYHTMCKQCREFHAEEIAKHRQERAAKESQAKADREERIKAARLIWNEKHNILVRSPRRHNGK